MMTDDVSEDVSEPHAERARSFPDLGTHHPDFTYPNDVRQAKLALVLSAVAALGCSFMIAVTVLTA